MAGSDGFFYGPNNIQTPTKEDPNAPLPNIPVPVPAMPKPEVFTFPQKVFDQMSQKMGVRILWKKSHFCPCVEIGNGSPLPTCNTCFGNGFFWDPPEGPFTVILASAITQESQRAPGYSVNERVGEYQMTGPWVTITPSNGKLYDQISAYDLIIETDAVRRIQETFVQGNNVPLSYVTNASITEVRYYNTETNQTILLLKNDYSFDPKTGIIHTNLPQGTAFSVEYYVPYSYIVFGHIGGVTHVRPLIQGKVSFPKRVRTEYADIWMRASNKKLIMV